MPETPTPKFSVAAAGDAMVTRRISQLETPGSRQLYETIEGTDAALVNLEMPVNGYEPFATSKHIRAWDLSTYPWAADELASVGFNLFSLANNHSGDYDQEGMMRTVRELEARGLAYAGVGRDLAAARSPAYLDTAAGRVAMISASTAVVPGTEAGAGNADVDGRPGLNPLRKETRYVVTDEYFEMLQQLSEDLGMEALKERRRKLVRVSDETDSRFSFFDVGQAAVGGELVFERGEQNTVRQDVDETDLEALRTSIRKARHQSNWTVVSIHSHEPNHATDDDSPIPAFLEDVAHVSVEAGADVVVVHGVHGIRGIEIRDRTPIFYGIGGFSMQIETMDRLPQRGYERTGASPDSIPSEVIEPWTADLREGWWTGFVPVCRFEDEHLQRIELYPIDTYDPSRARRGNPKLADEPRAEELVSTISDESAGYDTDVSFEDGIGVVSI